MAPWLAEQRAIQPDSADSGRVLLLDLAQQLATLQGRCDAVLVMRVRPPQVRAAIERPVAHSTVVVTLVSDVPGARRTSWASTTWPPGGAIPRPRCWPASSGRGRAHRHRDGSREAARPRRAAVRLRAGDGRRAPAPHAAAGHRGPGPLLTAPSRVGQAAEEGAELAALGTASALARGIQAALAPAGGQQRHLARHEPTPHARPRCSTAWPMPSSTRTPAMRCAPHAASRWPRCPASGCWPTRARIRIDIFLKDNPMITLGVDIGVRREGGAGRRRRPRHRRAAASRSASAAHPGWSEQSPTTGGPPPRRARRAEGISTRPELADTAAIGLSGQITAPLVGADAPRCAPCMLWNDGRSDVGVHRSSSATGRTARGDRQHRDARPPAPKGRLVRKHRGGRVRASPRVLLPKGPAALEVTGDSQAEDMSDARHALARRRRAALVGGRAGRHWGSRWRRCRAPGGRQSEVAGQLRPELAARWGMRRAPLLAGGAGDNAAGGRGRGTPGGAKISFDSARAGAGATTREVPRPTARARCILPSAKRGAEHLAPDGRAAVGVTSRHGPALSQTVAKRSTPTRRPARWFAPPPAASARRTTTPAMRRFPRPTADTCGCRHDAGRAEGVAYSCATRSSRRPPGTALSETADKSAAARARRLWCRPSPRAGHHPATGGRARSAAPSARPGWRAWRRATDSRRVNTGHLAAKPAARGAARSATTSGNASTRWRASSRADIAQERDVTGQTPP